MIDRAHSKSCAHSERALGRPDFARDQRFLPPFDQRLLEMVCPLLLIRPIEPFSSELPSAKPRFVPERSFPAEREVPDGAAPGKPLRDRIKVDSETRNPYANAKLSVKVYTIVVHGG